MYFKSYKNLLFLPLHCHLVTRVIKDQIQEVGGEDAQDVNLDLAGLHVVRPQQPGVLHHDSLVEVSLVSSEDN